MEAAKALKKCFSLHLLRSPAASCTCFKILQNFIFLHFTVKYRDTWAIWEILFVLETYYFVVLLVSEIHNDIV